jgi:predicted ATPase with chaperone activity
MGPRQIKRHCKLSDDSQELICVAHDRTKPERPAPTIRILKVSRTVADLAQSDSIGPEDVSEATQISNIRSDLWV